MLDKKADHWVGHKHVGDGTFEKPLGRLMSLKLERQLVDEYDSIHENVDSRGQV